ncbi:MAG: hypothetical protein A3B96_02085 [Candidatus Spechtbacteria bacterium RIFCSPHIGHO2_02_FULL_43_15b]|nr:MAG: hypothetical protein A3B96_02085 [Candidatus Spechtbacteria bacterium RIFCSPHIGHO2_02_FULL_43_15b]
MKKLTPLVLSIAILGIVAALPAGAQTSPVSECNLSSDIKVKGITVLTNSLVKTGDVSIVALDTGASPTNPAVGIEGGVGVTVSTSDWGSICLVNTINKIVDWLFFIMLTVAFALIVVAAFLWVTSAGDSAKQESAKKMIIAAMVGLVIALFARILPAVILGIVT